MKCAEIISHLKDVLQGDEMIICSNGHISRVAYHLLSRSQLYLRGSMGLPMSVGLGLALSHPNKTIIVLTGDGNFLMGLGSCTTISYMSPNNLRIIILDNEAYATTGGQETVSKVVNFVTMIRGIGITSIHSIGRHTFENDLLKLLAQTIHEPGLRVLHIKIEKEIMRFENIPLHPVEICLNFKKRHKIMTNIKNM